MRIESDDEDIEIQREVIRTSIAVLDLVTGELEVVEQERAEALQACGAGGVNLAELLDQYGDAIARTVIDTYPPLYDADVRRARGADLRRLLRRPLGAQADAINATVLSLKQRPARSWSERWEPGKSYIAAAAAYLAGCRRILIVSPPHLVKKWRREILQTVPGAHATIVRTIGDLERPEALVRTIAVRHLLARAGEARLPLDACRGGATASDARMAASSRGDDGRIRALLCCPSCFAAGDRRRGRATDAVRASGQEASLSSLRRTALAGRPHRASSCPAGRLHSSPNAGLLRSAGRSTRATSTRRGARRRASLPSRSLVPVRRRSR